MDNFYPVLKHKVQRFVIVQHLQGLISRTYLSLSRQTYQKSKISFMTLRQSIMGGSTVFLGR